MNRYQNSATEQKTAPWQLLVKCLTNVDSLQEALMFLVGKVLWKTKEV